VISSQSFVDRHLRLANRRDGSRCRSLLFLPDYDQVTDTTAHAWSPGRSLVPVLSDERLRRVTAVTRQCRGLVVLEAGRPTHHSQNYFMGLNTTYRVNHYVCNPSTGQMTALPKGEEAFGLWPHDHDSLGIGYDERIQKHKVVRIYCRGALPPACQVYVLNSTTKCWRPPVGAADRAMPPGFVTNYCTDQSVFAQGYLYWIAQPYRKFNHQRVIISFSISDEVFGILPAPPLKPPTFLFEMTELDGRLCLFNNHDSYMALFDIWVLHDHQAGTWGIHCRIDLDRTSLADTRLFGVPRVNPLDIVDDGSHILLRRDPHDVRKENAEAHHLYFYRPMSGDVEDLLDDGGIITHHTMARRVAVPYEESLESTG
jgi:F-box interacting protein